MLQVLLGPSGRKARRSAGIAIAIACVAVIGRGARAQAGEGGVAGAIAPASGQAASARSLVRGQLVSRYWLRWTGDETDNDIYETLSLDIGDPDRHAVTGHLQGRLSADLDGGTGSQPFASLHDSFDGRLTGHLYHAYADLHRVPGFALVRAGRQLIHDAPELAFFDGLRGETEEFGGIAGQLGVYGGASARLYEASPRGDWMTGLYLQGRPWSGGRLRLDWMHLEDETLLGPHADDLLGAGVWQSVGERIRLEGQYTRIEDRDRDVRTRAYYTDAASELLVQVSYYQLLRTQRELVVELDPFFSALQELFPYRQIGLLASKGLWQRLDVQVGVDLRRVSDQDDIGQFNRDYDRWFTTLTVRDVLADGLSVGITADHWNSDAQDVRTWGADAGYRLDAALDLSAGTYYSLYKFDLLLNRERDDVRTYYARLRYKTSRSVTLDLSYEIEDDDFDLYHTLRMGMSWRF
jgi:hypothetical protein